MEEDYKKRIEDLEANLKLVTEVVGQHEGLLSRVVIMSEVALSLWSDKGVDISGKMEDLVKNLEKNNPQLFKKIH